MSSTRLIKRYANRKLYDTSDSRYIKLDEIAQMIDAGEDLRIIDNESKEDITRVTLAQILVDQERKGRLGDSVASLKGLIRNKGEQIQKAFTEPVNTIRFSVEESVNKLIKTGEERATETREQFASWVEQNSLAIDELQRKLDERVRVAVGRMDLPAQLEDLKERIENLEAQLAKRTDEDDT
jgi:polyhydroxyalkanoate synthesis repressor PhaR